MLRQGELRSFQPSYKLRQAETGFAPTQPPAVIIQIVKRFRQSAKRRILIFEMFLSLGQSKGFVFRVFRCLLGHISFYL